MSIKNMDIVMWCEICNKLIDPYEDDAFACIANCGNDICINCYSRFKSAIHNDSSFHNGELVMGCSYKCLVKKCIKITEYNVEAVLKTKDIINYDLETFNKIKNYEKIKTVELWKNCIGILGKNVLGIVKEYLV